MATVSNRPGGETRSPRRVSPDVEEVPNARVPIWPGSPRPSPAQRGRGEPSTDSRHEVLVAGELDRPTFERIRDIVHARSGIVLKDDKATLVAARLGRRLRELGSHSPREYLKILEADSSGAELTNLLDAISTNVTCFFREPDHFELISQLHSRWLAAGQRRFRYWCAAASSGEEPYTLAMTLHALGSSGVDLKILATDISTAILERAITGAYPEKAVAEIPRALLTRYFRKQGSGAAATYDVADDLRKLITFRYLNLAVFPSPLHGPLDMILCRNVMIYFDHALRSRLVNEFARLLKPGGSLIISHAESLVGIDVDLKMVRPSVYVKPSVAAGAAPRASTDGCG